MQVELLKEHHWLTKLVGNWEFESECQPGPDQPPMKYKGAESVRSLGGAWTLCEGGGEMPGGGTGNMLMTLGYDPTKKRFVGTFIGSMMTFMWQYDGELDEAGKVLTLNAEGPNFAVEGKMAQYKDVITLESDDQRTLTSQFLGDDGQWHQFMKATYRRVK